MSDDLPMIIDAETLPAAPEPDHGDLLLSSAGFAHGMSLAQTLAQSRMIPAGFRGKPADILLAVDLARRMGEHPVAVMQNLHFVGDKPGWSATFLIARAANSGIFAGPLEFDTTGEGPTMAVTCSGVLRGSGKRVSRTVSMAMAKAEGWTRNAKYSSIGEQMLSYRSAAFLLRLYAPNIMLGLRTSDELQDIDAADGRVVDRIHVGSAPEADPEKTRSRKARAIDAEPIAEHVALVEEMVQGRQVAPEVTETPSVDPTGPVRSKTWKEGDHDSWEPSRVKFCIAVRELGLGHDNEVVFDYAEQAYTLHKRPRQMDPEERKTFYRHLRSDDGRAALTEYVADRAEREARDVEPDEVVAETAEVSQ